MNIHVLCVNSQSYRKTKYSSVFSEDTNLSFSKCTGSVFAVEKALKKAVSNWRSTDYIILDKALGRDSEKSFRKLFAGIIYRYEKTIQEDPKAIEKKIKKERKAKKAENIQAGTEAVTEEIAEDATEKVAESNIFNYQRKKTHIFPVEVDGLTGYAFMYAEHKILVLPKGLKADFFPEFVKKSQQIFDENAETYPDGYSLIDKTYKILTFREKWFPVKGDDIRECTRKITQLAAAGVFVVAGLLLIYNMVYLPAENDKLLSDIQFIAGTTETDPKTGKTVKAINWKELKKINEEIVGWVKLNNTVIDYPILEHKGDNAEGQYYLYRNYKKESSGFGSIFMDYRSKEGMKSKNVILHGHHMDDGSMFSDLMNYGLMTGNLEFYKKTPTIQISTPDGGTETYKIFSVFKSNVDPEQGEYFDFYCSDFESDAQLMNYIYNLQIRSLITTPVTVNEDDQLLTLVTCSYEFKEFRTVVVARKCRKGESADVDVGKASIPPTSLWPQIYYSTYGRTRPAVSTFQTEYKKGNIKWYDGKFELEGAEELPTSTLITLPKYRIKVYNRGKLIKEFDVEQGKSFTLPTISTTYKEGGYEYTFKEWKCEGSKSLKEITADTKITAVYDKKKIPATTAATTKPKATQKPTQKPTQKATKPKETNPKTTKATKATKPTKATETTAATTPSATEPIEKETEAVEE